MRVGVLLAGVSIVLSACMAMTDQASAQEVPLDAAHQIEVTSQLLDVFTQYHIGRRSPDMVDFRIEQHDGFIRKLSQFSYERGPVTEDFYYDSARTACFAEAATIQCFSQVGFRKKSSVSREAIEGKEFFFVQRDFTLRSLDSGDLKVVRVCTYGKCKDIR